MSSVGSDTAISPAPPSPSGAKRGSFSGPGSKPNRRSKDQPLQSSLKPSHCTRCQEPITPVVDTYPTWKTHMVAAILFIIGLPFCIFVPYCFDYFGMEVMRCPKCGCYVNS